MHQEAEPLQVAFVLGAGPFQHRALDVFHAVPLLQDFWAWVLDGQHVERFLAHGKHSLKG